MPAPAIVVEDGTGIANANSYLSVANAQLYFDARLYPEAWNAFDPDKKSAALQWSTKLIDANTQWKGYRTTTTQALEWPRIYVPDNRISPWHWTYDPLAPWPQCGPVYAPNVIPKLLKDAVAEMAGEMAKIDRAAEWDAIGVSSVGLGQGALSVSFAPGAEKLQRLFTNAVVAFLDPLGFPMQTSSQARVYRAV
jgi:hypothetical protein